MSLHPGFAVHHSPSLSLCACLAEAWTLAPGATDALAQMRQAGVLLAVVSNFDTRLRKVWVWVWVKLSVFVCACICQLQKGAHVRRVGVPIGARARVCICV